MKIRYSGIDLEVIHLLDFERVPVMSDDSVDYLYTKFTVRAIGIVSSDQVEAALRKKADDTIGMSFVQEGFAELSGGGKPVLGRPSSLTHSQKSNPIITDRAIRHWLSIPRRRLVIEHDNPALGNVLLQSPRTGAVTDARNGPVSEVYAVQGALGDARVFIVSLQITAFVNECEEATGSFGAFLSNRFSQTQDIDQDGFIQILTEGEARFRTDLIYGQLNPDAVRPYLFLPIPNGFKRDQIEVNSLSDVTGLRYQFVDRQLPQQLVVGDEIGATRVEATYRQVMLTNEDALGTALDAIERHYNIAVNSKWAQPDDETKDKRPRRRRRRPKTPPPPPTP